LTVSGSYWRECRDGLKGRSSSPMLSDLRAKASLAARFRLIFLFSSLYPRRVLQESRGCRLDDVRRLRPKCRNRHVRSLPGDPFGQEFALGLLLLVILTLHFQNQRFPIRQSNQKIGPKFVNHTFKGVGNLKADMIVLNPGQLLASASADCNSRPKVLSHAKE
jgi:hypothetical protein